MTSHLSSPLTPELAHTNGGLEKTLRLRLAELEAEYADVKRRLYDLRAELDVEQESEPNTQDSDTTDEQGMSALWVAQTALIEMRQRYEEQRAGRREAEKKCSYLDSVVKQMEAASRVMTTSLQELAAESESQAGEVDAAVAISLELRKELGLMQAKFEESSDNLEIAAAEISALKIALEKMDTDMRKKLVHYKAKFEALQDEVQTVRGALEMVFDDAEETKMTKSDLELNQADRRLAHEELTNINAIAEQLHKKLKTQSAAVSRMEKSNARLQRKHEELKHTCRELIALVEGLEAAGDPVDDVDALTRLHQKYKQIKAEQEELRAKLGKVERKNSRLKTTLEAVRAARCKTEDGDEG
ncbi:hypothetical protein MVEN_02389000 [Mycena venus]|uniref:Uncharacterized protein n=1 Tax=Mycena venus TaxID=2733690 RepID=A0A8H6X252_9AGAR|nr:hypothetical protein MVEN_02389000 [Mycena venus]